MPTFVVSVRLDADMKGRLDALSATTGRPAASFVRQALAEHLAELEYVYPLRGEAEAIRRGDVETILSSVLAAELFLMSRQGRYAPRAAGRERPGAGRAGQADRRRS